MAQTLRKRIKVAEEGTGDADRDHNADNEYRDIVEITTERAVKSDILP